MTKRHPWSGEMARPMKLHGNQSMSRVGAFCSSHTRSTKEMSCVCL